MAVRRWRKLAILNKVEAAYGTDSVPAAVNALVGKNVTFTPMDGEEVGRDLLLPYMGNQGVVLAGVYGRLEFDLELAGAGAAGTVPKCGSMLRAAGFAETVTAGTSVDYTIVEDAIESTSLYFISDKVQHKFTGGQANIALNWTAKAYPYFRVTYLGLLGAVSDIGAMPTVSLAGWTTPLVVSKAATTMTLHGWNAVAENVSIDLGNTLTPRFLIGDEKIMISERSSTGTAVVEARPLADINWFEIAKARTRGPLSIIHGTTPGNIVEVTAPAVEIGRPSQGNTNGISNYSLPLALCPSVGLDELSIVFR